MVCQLCAICDLNKEGLRVPADRLEFQFGMQRKELVNRLSAPDESGVVVDLDVSTWRNIGRPRLQTKLYRFIKVRIDMQKGNPVDTCLCKGFIEPSLVKNESIEIYI